MPPPTTSRQRNRIAHLLVPSAVALAACLAMGYAWFAMRASPLQGAGPPSVERLLNAAVAVYAAPSATGSDKDPFIALAVAPVFSGPDGKAQRQRLSTAVRPLLIPSTSLPLLSAAAAAAIRQHCDGLAAATAELVCAAPDLADRLGGATALSELTTRCGPDEADAPRLLDALSRLIGRGGSARSLANLTLMRLGSDAWIAVPGFRPCLAALAQDLPFPASLETLRHLVVDVGRLSDAGTTLDANPDAWRAWVEAEASASTRFAEITAWISANGIDRVSLGEPKLEEHRRFLIRAQRDLQAWLGDEAWTAPLGWRRPEVESLLQKIRQAQYANRTALGGTGTD